MSTDPFKILSKDKPYDLLKIVTDYFATVTPEQLEADLKAADFDHWNSVGDGIIIDPSDPDRIQRLTLSPDSSIVTPHS